MTITEKLASMSRPLSKDPQPEVEVIAGLYPRGYFSLFASPPGTGKTWFMQYIACQLSVGGNILHGLRINDKPKKVVILAGETGRYLLDRRARLTDWDYDPDNLHIYDAIEMQREGLSLLLNEQDGRNMFLAIIAQEQPDIVFIDTLISFHSADETKQGDMTSIYGFLLKTAKGADCAIVANHHTRKRGQKQQGSPLTLDDVIGTSTGTRLASAVYIAEQVEQLSVDDNDGLPVVNVRNVKNWNRKLPDFSYAFYRTPYTPSRLDFRVTWGLTAGQEERSIRERCYGCLRAFGIGATLTAETVAREVCTSKDNARKYLAETEKNGYTEKLTVPFGSGNIPAWRIKRLPENL